MEFAHGYVPVPLLQRAALAGNNLGSFDLSNWAIFTGTGEITESPTGDAYLTKRANDAASYAPFPMADVGYFFNDQGSTFRVHRQWTTTPSTSYNVDLDISFISAGRATLRMYNAVGTAITAGQSPFNSAQSINFSFTTEAGANGATTYLRITEHSTAALIGLFFSEPALS